MRADAVGCIDRESAVEGGENAQNDRKEGLKMARVGTGGEGSTRA